MVVVSDGSYMETMGATTWMIEAAIASNRIVGTGYMPGATDNQSTYRSKLFGLWGTIQKFIREMCITTGAMTIT